ncbi:hypothetical protein COP1_015998 [Malus domestica]
MDLFTHKVQPIFSLDAKPDLRFVRRNVNSRPSEGKWAHIASEGDQLCPMVEGPIFSKWTAPPQFRRPRLPRPKAYVEKKQKQQQQQRQQQPVTPIPTRTVEDKMAPVVELNTR